MLIEITVEENSKKYDSPETQNKIIWQLVIEGNIKSFTLKGYGPNSSFINIKNHAIFKAQILQRINVRLQKLTVRKFINITIHFKSSLNKRYLESQISIMNILKARALK
jgi:hypothetical protein